MKLGLDDMLVLIGIASAGAGALLIEPLALLVVLGFMSFLLGLALWMKRR